MDQTALDIVPQFDAPGNLPNDFSLLAIPTSSISVTEGPLVIRVDPSQSGRDSGFFRYHSIVSSLPTSIPTTLPQT